ncbi:MAG: hypothetical protein ACFE78_08675, partial [Candidatus Hodarchaeota archaeon]
MKIKIFFNKIIQGYLIQTIIFSKSLKRDIKRSYLWILEVLNPTSQFHSFNNSIDGNHICS